MLLAKRLRLGVNDVKECQGIGANEVRDNYQQRSYRCRDQHTWTPQRAPLRAPQHGCDDGQQRRPQWQSCPKRQSGDDGGDNRDNLHKWIHWMERVKASWLPSRLIPHRHRPRAELQPAHELQVDMLR